MEQRIWEFMFSFIWREISKWETAWGILIYAEMHGILKNFFNKMVDSKIYFNFSIWKNKPQNKKPNYTHIYSVNIFRALTLGNIVSLQLYDNTVYATIRFRQTIASAVIQTPWFYISVHKKKIDISPALCFLQPLPVRGPAERLPHVL